MEISSGVTSLEEQVTLAYVTVLRGCCQRSTKLTNTAWYVIDAIKPHEWHLRELLGLGPEDYEFLLHAVGWTRRHGKAIRFRQDEVEAFVHVKLIATDACCWISWSESIATSKVFG